MGFHGSPITTAALAGLAILGAAFVLSWVAEVAQLDISQSFAVAIVALIAVLPEYAVDLLFAWKAGQDPVYGQYALANMTGGNRLLIGVGWSLVVFLFWWRTRQPVLEMRRQEGLEISVLSVVTIYAFFIPIKGTLSLMDAVILIGAFLAYIAATTRQNAEEVHCVGPAAAIASCATPKRRLITILLGAFAALAIIVSAEPFAEGLIGSGRLLQIDEFLLVQWLAPLASESPEFVLATLFVLRGQARLGFRSMISSKVNQWTLLVGSLPIAYAISAGAALPLVLDVRQSEEVLLTAAQSVFAVALLAGLRFPVWGAGALFALFIIQLLIPDLRAPLSVVYLLLGMGIFVTDRSRLGIVADGAKWLVRPSSAVSSDCPVYQRGK
jgi:cation:H+ antiporter